MSHTFEIFTDKAGEYRVRFKYRSEVMFSTHGYSSKSTALNAIASIKKNGPSSPVEDNTGTVTKVTEGEKIMKVVEKSQPPADPVQEIKDRLNQLTYTQMITLAKDLMGHIPYEPDEADFAGGISSWANS